MNRVRAATDWGNGDIASRNGTSDHNAKGAQDRALRTPFLMKARRRRWLFN